MPSRCLRGSDSCGVPALIEPGRLLQITERILRDKETDEDLQLIFAPGSSLGGARPKASAIAQHSHLSIATFPKETTARAVGARPLEINRMASVFEHDDLKQALAR